MTPTRSDATLLQPRQSARAASAPSSGTGLPSDLVRQSGDRLRVLALLYASVFLLAEFFPAILSEADRAALFGSLTMWVPAVVAISAALIVAAVVHAGSLRPASVVALGLVFEVAGSYGIAAAEFLHVMGDEARFRWQGLSWVAVWTLLFTVVVPTSPRRTLIAALLSVSAVPVVNGLSMAIGLTTLVPDPLQFFVWLVFPYLLVVVMAYVGAHVVFGLGREVQRARELGSYRLIRRLGEGGMGEVWFAKHRLLARPAAIKLIRPSLVSAAGRGGSTDVLRRFEREAQAIAGLRSAHTVTLFDFGVADDGAFYYAMELLDGIDAERLVHRFGPLPYARVVHILRQMCHSLSEADARGLVHRDIKPANVFLCRHGEDFDFVKVLDFGLVKALDAHEDTSPALTREHAIHGTPAFMAPEQALGQPVLDGRVDIYATGCVAFWLLTGRRVFEVDTAMAHLMHHTQSAPSAPSTRTDLPIPAGLDVLVLACLEKDPERRPQTARELARRLDDLEGAHAWTPDSARDWWAAHEVVGPAGE